MDYKYINNMLSEMDKDLSTKGMSRRDAMKLAGISGAGLLMGATNASAMEKDQKEIRPISHYKLPNALRAGLGKSFCRRGCPTR